ncbi:DUF397 domain-containing protein [Streptomyces griseoviridis]|jgi:hypothetical protein|uniref:DUF397 domain-containing protein n=1 Tax=Streptomyces TaxID=1883 RepID=UPI00167AFCC7|nr:MULTISPECIES: DUF397 domain-containing protein [Streptomyces]
MTDITGPFRKSSYSNQEGECVEVAETACLGRAVRDSKQHADGPLLIVSRESWAAFLRQIR